MPVPRGRKSWPTKLEIDDRSEGANSRGEKQGPYVSRTEDLPELWLPTTAIWGRSTVSPPIPEGVNKQQLQWKEKDVRTDLVEDVLQPANASRERDKRALVAWSATFATPSDSTRGKKREQAYRLTLEMRSESMSGEARMCDNKDGTNQISVLSVDTRRWRAESGGASEAMTGPERVRVRVRRAKVRGTGREMNNVRRPTEQPRSVVTTRAPSEQGSLSRSVVLKNVVSNSNGFGSRTKQI
jgi:hypothetical protein